MRSLIEFITADLSEAAFFKELCFRGQRFPVPETGECELADVFIWLESDGIIIQVKERAEDEPANQATFDKWFKNKVQGKGADQIADTLAFFKNHPSVVVKNARKLDFELHQVDAAMMHKLIVFGTLADGVDQHHQAKFRISKRSGFIHLIQAVDFANLLKWTVTPGEMLEYLRFREQVVQQWDVAKKRTEKWLFGCFVHWSGSGRDPECLEESVGEAQVDGLIDDTEQANLRRFYDVLGSWASTTADPSSFGHMLVELAHMPRLFAREFKTRVLKCMERLDKPFPRTLYRLYNQPRDCLFVLTIPLGDSIQQREEVSRDLLRAAKYGERTRKAVGLFFAAQGKDEMGISLVYLDEPWKESAQGEAAIAAFPILARPMRKVTGHAYSWTDETIDS